MRHETGVTQELVGVLSVLILIVLGMLLVTAVIVLDRQRVLAVRGEVRERALVALPFLALLGGVLAFNARFRAAARELSDMFGLRITSLIFRIEGNTVVHIQQFIGEGATPFFSFMYVYGYVFLLMFPLVAYFFLQRMDTFNALAIAYAANYGIGLVCYVLFVAFGPRNRLPDLVDQLLYTSYPNLQLLTSEVNEATNVFPSLHASLSLTVMVFAWHTRDEYPAWTVIAIFVGTSIIISTMYLAIHWVLDVLAGFLLAGISVWIGLRATDSGWVDRAQERTGWNRVVENAR